MKYWVKREVEDHCKTLSLTDPFYYARVARHKFIFSFAIRQNILTFPLDQPVMSSGTPSESRSKLWMVIAWFFDWKKKKKLN